MRLLTLAVVAAAWFYDIIVPSLETCYYSLCVYFTFVIVKLAHDVVSACIEGKYLLPARVLMI